MFKKENLICFLIIFLTACQNNVQTDDKKGANLILSESNSSLECLGNVGFKPQPGITTELNENMIELANQLCDSPAIIHEKHVFSDSGKNNNVNVIYLRKAKVEFSCANNALPSPALVPNIAKSCSEVFEKFDAKQR
jgi:hypothetical protein